METPLPLFSPLPTPDEMRLWDETASNAFGIPPLLLMENAGREAFLLLRQRYQLMEKTMVLVLMGGGNNGGDGAVVARYLQDAGCQVLVWHTTPLGKLRGHVRQHVAMAQKAGVNFLPVGSRETMFLPHEWRYPDIIVDALMGTGMRSDLREREAAIVQIINTRHEYSFIYALDVPSGLCGYLGKPRPDAVRAHLTVTFEAGKPGLFMPEAKNYTGDVVVLPIGMPATIAAVIPPSWRLLRPQAGKWSLPAPMLHKGKAGKILVIGGSKDLPGAPALAAYAALRCGAGLVHMACPQGIAAEIRAFCPEIIVHPHGDGPDWDDDAANELAELALRIKPGAIALGPGLGRSPQAHSIVKAILESKDRCPVILDADALHFFHLPNTRRQTPKVRKCQDLPLALLQEKDVVTPHPGEMAAMFRFQPQGDAPVVNDGSGSAGIRIVQADRAGALRAFTRECRASIVLKGPGTLIGQVDSPITLSPFVVPTLAVGGSGDVLTGICAALAASGIPPHEAACLSVHIHGRCGELLAEKHMRGHLAREIAEQIPVVWNELAPQ